MIAAVAPNQWLPVGIASVVAAVILFIGSVYVLLSAFFGLRMGYLVLAVSFFGWMIILTSIWTFGPPALGTPQNLGPRGTEPHWQVFAAGYGAVRSSEYPQTSRYPNRPWHPPDKISQPSVATVTTAVQEYALTQAERTLREQGTPFEPEPAAFVVQDVEFANASDGTHLAAAHVFYSQGGPELTVFVYHDKGNVPVYSWSFLAASIVGFAVHLPFLDRAERKRRAILTGGTAPPWYGPA